MTKNKNKFVRPPQAGDVVQSKEGYRKGIVVRVENGLVFYRTEARSSWDRATLFADPESELKLITLVKTTVMEEVIEPFEKWLATLRGMDISVQNIDVRGPGQGGGYYDRKEATLAPALMVEWSTGGTSGGSCWDDSNPQPYSTDNAPEELTDLDRILEKYWPEISFLQYRVLAAKLVKGGSYTEYEYYGNSTNRSFKLLWLRDLYTTLLEHDKL